MVIPDESDNSAEFIDAATIANRVGGFVNAPSLLQLVIARCVDAKCDVAYYERNGKTLYEGLTEAGFECTKPQGAFYMWMKSPIADEKEFVAAGKKYNLLMVPGSSFACPGYVRISDVYKRQDARSAREAAAGGITGGVLLMVTVVFMNFALLSQLDQIEGSIVPSLILADEVSSLAGTVFVVVMILSLIHI